MDGSDGQMPLCGVVGLPGSNADGAETFELGASGAWIGLIAASGMTAATAGSASSRCCASAETIAAKPLRTVYLRVTDTPDAPTRAISDRRSPA